MKKKCVSQGSDCPSLRFRFKHSFVALMIDEHREVNKRGHTNESVLVVANHRPEDSALIKEKKSLISYARVIFVFYVHR